MAPDDKVLQPGAGTNLDAFWMPFTANRQFRARPKMLVAAKDMHYTTADGRRLLDGAAGLWCVNAGHNRDPISAAMKAQIDAMDFAPPFQIGHPKAFEAAAKVAALAPANLNHVFFTNSGSESVDTALKIALAYQRIRGQGTR
ncbi:MAG TPA: aminotransferase class III-fold pyridoxal phosphate-dependent enzyme, partial [Stellaceae bacterium]|nr:aminotransferase class III-fold pyridoxal phosphate-dependent enzyme [Stellaceae bacterium]